MMSHKNVDGVNVTVAACDIPTVKGATVPRNVMVVLAGMPGPMMGCPTTRPDNELPLIAVTTFVSWLLPAVVMALNVIVAGVRLAAFDIVIEAGVAPAAGMSAVMVVLAGMPVVPVRACPTIIPLKLCTFAMVLLPEVMAPVVETVLLALAAVTIVTVAAVELATKLAMVFPPAMPTPEVRGCPTTNPDVFDTFVMVLLPVVTMPLNVTSCVVALEAVAVTVAPEAEPIVILLPRFEMIVPAGMPTAVVEAKLIGCPTAIPEVPATGVMVELPLVTTPTNVIMGVVVAGVDIVIVVGIPVPEAVAVMVAPEGMPAVDGMPKNPVAPVMGCPSVRPEVLDTPVRVALPLVT